MLITLVAVFISVALVAGLAASAVMSSTSAERRRLRAVTQKSDAAPLPEILPLSTDPRADGWPRAAPMFGLSRKDLSTLRIKMLRAGYEHPGAPVVYAAF